MLARQEGGKRRCSAGADEVFDGELVELDEAVAALTGSIRVEVGNGRVRTQVGERLSRRQRWFTEGVNAGCMHSLAHLRVGAVGRGSLPQEQVGRDIRPC